MSLRTFLVESTWGYPIIGAIHVLALAWFGGALFVESVHLRRIGIGLLLITGAVLFWLQPQRYVHSVSFQLKLVLIVAALLTGKRVSLVLWLLVIVASRGIPFF